MFDLNLQAVNPSVTRAWLIRCGVTVGGTGIISVTTLVDRIRHLFPVEFLLRLSNYEQFIYMALGIAFVTALPLTMFRVVVSLSFAQMGFASSLLYLGCSILGVFIYGYKVILMILLIIMAGIFELAFSVGPRFAYGEKKWSDFTLGLGLQVVFLGVWLFPLWKLWRLK
jgi:hypothetical protein